MHSHFRDVQFSDEDVCVYMVTSRSLVPDTGDKGLKFLLTDNTRTDLCS